MPIYTVHQEDLILKTNGKCKGSQTILCNGFQSANWHCLPQTSVYFTLTNMLAIQIQQVNASAVDDESAPWKHSFISFFQIHLRQRKTSVVRQIWPTPTLWSAVGTPGCRRPTCPPSTPSTQRYGNLQSIKTPSHRNAWKQSKFAQLCASNMTIMSFQGRKEPLLRAATRSPPLHDTSHWLYPVLWDENMCEGGEWAGRSNLSANCFRTHQCRWSMWSLMHVHVSPFITETKEFYHSFFLRHPFVISLCSCQPWSHLQS